MSNFEIGSVVLLVLAVAAILIVALVRQVSAIGPTPGESRTEPDKSRRGGKLVHRLPLSRQVQCTCGWVVVGEGYESVKLAKTLVCKSCGIQHELVSTTMLSDKALVVSSNQLHEACRKESAWFAKLSDAYPEVARKLLQRVQKDEKVKMRLDNVACNIWWLGQLWLVFMDGDNFELTKDREIYEHIKSLALSPPTCSIDKEAASWMKLRAAGMSKFDIRLGLDCAVAEAGNFLVLNGNYEDTFQFLVGNSSSRSKVQVVDSSSKIQEIERRVSELIERLDSISISEVQVAFRSSEEIDATLNEFEKIARVAAELMNRNLEEAYSNSISPETVSEIWAAFSTRLGQGPIRRR